MSNEVFQSFLVSIKLGAEERKGKKNTSYSRYIIYSSPFEKIIKYIEHRVGF